MWVATGWAKPPVACIWARPACVLQPPAQFPALPATCVALPLLFHCPGLLYLDHYWLRLQASPPSNCPSPSACLASRLALSVGFLTPFPPLPCYCLSWAAPFAGGQAFSYSESTLYSVQCVQSAHIVLSRSLSYGAGAAALHSQIAPIIARKMSLSLPNPGHLHLAPPCQAQALDLPYRPPISLLSRTGPGQPPFKPPYSCTRSLAYLTCNSVQSCFFFVFAPVRAFTLPLLPSLHALRLCILFFSFPFLSLFLALSSFAIVTRSSTSIAFGGGRLFPFVFVLVSVPCSTSLALS